MPVTVLYNQLYHQDHFAELTGRPAWELHKWLCAPPEEHLAIYRLMLERAPFEILQPQCAPDRESREHIEFIEQDGQVIRRDRRTGRCEPLTIHTGHPFQYRANETQRVLSIRDANEKIIIHRAEEIRRNGCHDYIEAAVAAFGRDQFILSGGVVGTLFSCNDYLGQTNALRMLIDQPDLVEHLCRKITERNIEIIRALAATGGDAIYIDDSTATADVISVKHYERFSLPYMQQMTREAHRLGQKVIILYFGGIADRLDWLAEIGADGLSMETSMKGYVNDIEGICQRIGQRVTLFGNIDPIGVLQNGTDEALEAEICRQAAAGRRARGFILCTGSPITPGTPLARVQRFIETGRKHGIYSPADAGGGGRQG